MCRGRGRWRNLHPFHRTLWPRGDCQHYPVLYEYAFWNATDKLCRACPRIEIHRELKLPCGQDVSSGVNHDAIASLITDITHTCGECELDILGGGDWHADDGQQDNKNSREWHGKPTCGSLIGTALRHRVLPSIG